MLSLDQIKERLKDRNLSEVGRRLGISPQYMQQLATGLAKNPSYAVMIKLSTYLEQNS